MTLTFIVPDPVAFAPVFHAYGGVPVKCDVGIQNELQAEPPTHPDGTPATDFCVQANDRIVEQFKGPPDIQKLICLIGDQATPIEQALINTKEFRQIGTALGQQLDEIGKLYNEPRNADGDTDYRRRLLAMSSVVASKGLAEDLIETLVALDNGFSPSDIHLLEHHPAGVILTARVPLGGFDLGVTMGRFLQRAKAGGIRLELYFEEQGANLFVWSGDPGGGWDDGIWAEVI